MALLLSWSTRTIIALHMAQQSRGPPHLGRQSLRICAVLLRALRRRLAGDASGARTGRIAWPITRQQMPQCHMTIGRLGRYFRSLAPEAKVAAERWRHGQLAEICTCSGCPLVLGLLAGCGLAVRRCRALDVPPAGCHAEVSLRCLASPLCRRTAMAVDIAHRAADRIRHGSACHPLSLFAARLKELALPHPGCRSAMPWPCLACFHASIRGCLDRLGGAPLATEKMRLHPLLLHCRAARPRPWTELRLCHSSRKNKLCRGFAPTRLASASILSVTVSLCRCTL